MIRIPRHDEDLLEAVLQRLVLAQLNAVPGVRLWRANAGGARDSATGRLLKFGTPGQADLTGLIGPSGRRLELELKAARGRQTPEQKLWQAEITRYGGLYILARTLEQAMVPVCDALGIPYAVE